MSVSDYTFFNVLASELNISKAAEHLYISPQALSKRLIKLEEYYGTALFERKPQFRLTYAGERLLQYYNDLAALEEKARAEIKEIANKNSGQIRVGISPVRSTQKLSRAMSKYNKIHPNIQLILVDGLFSKLVKDLIDGLLDMIIAVSTIDGFEAQHFVLDSERSHLIISDECLKKYCSNHYDKLLEAEAVSSPVSLYEFSKCPFAFQTTETRVRYKINQAFSQCHIHPKIVFTANSVDFRVNVAKNGSAATILDLPVDNPFGGVMIEKDSGMHCFSLLELDNTSSVKCTYMTERHMPQYVKDFMEMLQNMY